MIDDDITQAANISNVDKKTDTAQNPDEIYSKQAPTDYGQPESKSNPNKLIGLLIGGCLLLMLCCCCCGLIFLPSGFSQQSIDDLCTVLNAEGQSDPFGICPQPSK